MLDSLKQKISKKWAGTKLLVLNTCLPEAEEDSWSDLTREKLEHEVKMGGRKAPPIVESDPRPVYRRDGQIHNFSAEPGPYVAMGFGRRLTRRQYQARYGGSRPEPASSVSNINALETK